MVHLVLKEVGLARFLASIPKCRANDCEEPDDLPIPAAAASSDDEAGPSQPAETLLSGLSVFGSARI